MFGVAASARLYLQENYVNHKPAIAKNEEMHMKVQGPAPSGQKSLNLFTHWLIALHVFQVDLHCWACKIFSFVHVNPY